MALAKRSAGTVRVRPGGGRHHFKAPMTPRLLKALIQKGAAMPRAAVMTPPNAGPTARLILMPTLLAVTATGKSALGTSWGTTDCQAGATAAEAAPIRKANNNKLLGVTR